MLTGLLLSEARQFCEGRMLAAPGRATRILVLEYGGLSR